MTVKEVLNKIPWNTKVRINLVFPWEKRHIIDDGLCESVNKHDYSSFTIKSISSISKNYILIEVGVE